MYIEQLRIDSSNLTLNELERISYITGDKATHEAVTRAIDEAESEDSPECQRLQSELEELQGEADANGNERDRLQDAMEVVAAFLRSAKVLTAEDLKSAADAISAFDPASRGSGSSLEQELDAIAGDATC